MQVYPDWLAGAQGEVSLRCKDLVLPLPPKATDGAVLQVISIVWLDASCCWDTCVQTESLRV